MKCIDYPGYPVPDFMAQMDQLRAGFKKKGVELALQDILLSCFNDFMEGKTCYYEQLLYMKALQAELINFCNKVSGAPFTELLIQHLLFLRFNHSAFISFYQLKIRAGLEPVFELRMQFDYLCAYEKALKIQTEWANGVFDKKSPAAHMAVLAYVKAELEYLQKKQNWDLGDRPLQLKTTAGPAYRIKVSISADALAYLLRLLVESGIIIAQPRSQLLGFVARNFQTPGIGEQLLSASSLGVKYLQVVQTTAKGVRAALMRMLKILDSRFAFVHFF